MVQNRLPKSYFQRLSVPRQSSVWLSIFFQTMNQLLEKMKQGEHVFDVNAEPEPEPEEDDCPDFDADYEEGLGDCEERSKEHKEGCEATVSGKGR